MVHGAHGAAALAGFHHAQQVRQGGDQPVALQKVIPVRGRTRRVLAHHGPLPVHLRPQAAVHGGVGLVNGRAQHAHRGPAGGKGRLVGLAVQPVGQAAHHDHLSPGQAIGQGAGCLGPIGAGAAAAHHAHPGAAGQCVRVSGAVQHHRRVGQVQQGQRIAGVPIGQHRHPQLIAGFQLRCKLFRGQRLHAAALFGPQQGGKVLAVPRLPEILGVAVQVQQGAGLGRGKAQHPRQPQPVEPVVHLSLPPGGGNATAAHCPPRWRSGFPPGR